MYKKLVEKKGQIPQKSQEKWLLDFNFDAGEVDWNATYSLPFQCTKSTKLKEFQFKFLHRQLPTNKLLQQIGLKDNEKCTFCQEVVEALPHLFWYRDEITLFWNCVTVFFQKVNLLSQTDRLDSKIALGLFYFLFH